MKLRTQLTSLLTRPRLLLAHCSLRPKGSPTDHDKTIDLTMIGDHTMGPPAHHRPPASRSQTRSRRRSRSRPLPHPRQAHGKAPYLNNPKSFIKNYDNIITPDIAAVIENQKYEALFVNYQGAMFGEGEVWITGKCVDNTCKHPDVKIGTIQSTAISKK